MVTKALKCGRGRRKGEAEGGGGRGRQKGGTESIRDEPLRPCSLEAGSGYPAKEREQLLEKKDEELKPPQSLRRAITLLTPCLQPCEAHSDSQLHNFAVTERSRLKTRNAWHSAAAARKMRTAPPNEQSRCAAQP